MKTDNRLVNWSVGIGLLFPLFFQLSGRIYNDFSTDSGGNIATLPLPVSVLACFGAMVLLHKQVSRAYIAWTFVAAMLLALLASVLLADAGSGVEIRKLILLGQFAMPMFALGLGQMIDDNDKVIPKAFLTVLLVVVPAQLMAGWMQGTLTLTHSLYVFSIYQHFQFVPLVFVCAFSYSMVALWDTHRILLLILSPFMLIYAVASVSFLTIAALIIFGAGFAYYRLRIGKKMNKALIFGAVLASTALIIAAVGAYYGIAKGKTSIVGDNGQYIAKFQSISEGRLPRNVSERMADWKLFGNGIIESPRMMAFGHAAPLAREVRTSAHNWYIDMVYSFGLISLLPVFLLIGYTVHLFRRSRDSLPFETQCLAYVVFYLVVIDSNFKVTLRQPYSGIFTYFLWGLLLSRLLVRAPLGRLGA